MSVFKALAEEHALLLSLVGRLERADDNKEARKLLLVLLQGLEAHESLEHLVFDSEAPGSGAEGEARALAERQHAALGGLRAEGAEVLRRLTFGAEPALRGLVRRLARLLRRHFGHEERELWPRFHASAGRSRLHRLDRLARAQVRAMKRELEQFLVAAEDYLT